MKTNTEKLVKYNGAERLVRPLAGMRDKQATVLITMLMAQKTCFLERALDIGLSTRVLPGRLNGIVGVGARSRTCGSGGRRTFLCRRMPK